MAGGALLAKGRAFGGFHRATQHIAGMAQWRFLRVNAGDVEAQLGIEVAIFCIEAPAALGDYADAAPGAIGDVEDLAEQLLRGAVAFKCDDAAISVLNFVPACFELYDRAANAFEQIERFEARDHDGNAELLHEWRVLPVTHHAAHVACCEKSLHLVAR